MRPTKPPKLILRIRSFPEGFCGVWIIARDGCTDSGLMHGEMIPQLAELLATTLGLPVEREESSATFDERQPVVTKDVLAKQSDLFA